MCVPQKLWNWGKYLKKLTLDQDLRLQRKVTILIYNIYIENNLKDNYFLKYTYFSLED